jgi:hypothetical protein
VINNTTARLRSLFAAAILGAGLFAVSPSVASAQTSFKGLAGSWSGSGTVVLKNGSTERVRCRGSASGGGASLNQSIRCASTSYRFVFNSSLRSAGRSVQGSVTESRSGFFGAVSGSANRNGFRLRIRGQNVPATGSIVASGRNQTINLSVQGRDVRRVSISLRRG